MAGAKSLLLFRTLLGPRKVLSQLGDLSIDSILCWSLWFDGASKDLRLLVDDRCGVFRATTAWSTCGLSSGYDYGTRTSGAPFSPTCPDFVQGWPPRFSDPAKKAEERLKAQEEFQKETQAHMEQIPCLEEDEEAGQLHTTEAEEYWDNTLSQYSSASFISSSPTT